MQLRELINHLDVLEMRGTDRVKIEGIAYDSRLVAPGSLFVAVEGFKVDGHDYIGQAAALGAAAVLVQKDVPVPEGLTSILVRDTRQGLAMVAAGFYGCPSQKMKMIGVTGTNGKTTTTSLIASVFRSAGARVGLIGTVANYIGPLKLPVSHTTPESADLQRLLGEMVEGGVEVNIMEVSSHALALNRVTGCEFDTAVFTNLTQDHLDFHLSMQNYLDAKALLFRGLGEGVKKCPKHAVVNLDDRYSGDIMAVCRVPVVTYGLSDRADIQARDIRITGSGCSYRATGVFGEEMLDLKLTGMFNVYNSLAAFAVGVTGGLSPHLVAGALNSVTGVPGRFQLVDCGQDFAVVVDYAHTPDGLENVLKTARQITEGRVIVVFGCGGDRDRSKRPLMGEVAGTYGDYVFITSDNPRTEDPGAIIADAEAGVRKVRPCKDYVVIPDRREAIRRAVAGAGAGDVVVIAGKGHEDYQIIGDRIIHFDDNEEARTALEMIKNRENRGR